LNALPAVASAFRFAFLWHRFDEGKIDETVFRAAARVLSPLGDGNLWNRRQVLAVLQDLVCVFGSYGAFLASVRHAVTDDSGDDFLRVYACHSAWSNLPPDEEEYPPVSKAGNAVGWEAIKQNCAITFDHACPWFRCIHSDSAKVKSGICVPLLTITPIGFVRGVLSLDFSSELRWTSDKVAVVFRAARKISAMGGPNIANDEARFVQITKPASLDAFLRRQAKKMNIAWGQIMLMRDGRLCPAAGVGTPPSEQQILRCIGEMRKHRLAPAQIEVRAYARRKMWAVPLFHGASEVGKIVAAVEEPFDIEATACRVGSLWSMFSNGPSKMRPSWDMRCERIDPQDYNVRGAQAWRCDASWIKE
jgi:hypothetical protein